MFAAHVPSPQANTPTTAAAFTQRLGGGRAVVGRLGMVVQFAFNLHHISLPRHGGGWQVGRVGRLGATAEQRESAQARRTGGRPGRPKPTCGVVCACASCVVQCMVCRAACDAGSPDATRGAERSRLASARVGSCPGPRCIAYTARM